MDEARPGDNIPQFSVSELSGAIRRALEGGFSRIRVRGELTEVKRYASGHIYLSLKDESAKLAGVVWKSVVPRLAIAPENGMEVIATGRVTAYGERSSYQLVIERLDYAGAGALLARIEALRVRLAGEGLFDAARKRPLPLLPDVIGVVTSAQGAVLHDIRTTIARRFPRPIVLWPVPVQGEGAAARIVAAIEGLAALADPRPDLIIVARGGGSLEDLMAFNDEAVVRAACACPVPLISAVGHETDTTLIDHAADRRAPTPTAAAELAVPVRAEMLAGLAQSGARLQGGLARRLQSARLLLHRAERGLPDLPSLAGMARQRLDDRAARLVVALPALISRAQGLTALRAEALRTGLRHFAGLRRNQATATMARLNDAPLRLMLGAAQGRLAGAARHLEAVAYPSVLARGYALVFDQAGHPVTQAAAIQPAARLTLRFADGTRTVREDSVAQGRLF